MDLLDRRRGSGTAEADSADVLPEVSAAAQRVAATVRRRHRVELVELHRALFSEVGERDYDLGPAYIPPGIIARAVRDPLARVSVRRRR